MAEKIKIIIDMTIEDFIQFNVDTVSQLKVIKSQFVILRILAILGLVISIGGLFLLSFIKSENILNQISIPFLLLFTFSILLLIMSFIKKLIPRITTKKIINEGSIKSYLGKNQFIFDEVFLHRENETRYERVRWDIMEKYVNEKNHIYIYDTIASAYIIPKRSLDDDTIMEILSFLKEKIRTSIK